MTQPHGRGAFRVWLMAHHSCITEPSRHEELWFDFLVTCFSFFSPWLFSTCLTLFPSLWLLLPSLSFIRPSPRWTAGVSWVPAFRVQWGEPWVLAGLRGLQGFSFKPAEDQGQQHLQPVYQPGRPAGGWWRGGCDIRGTQSVDTEGVRTKPNP